MNARRGLFILVITAILVGCSTVSGQEKSGQLIVRVMDTTGAMVPRAQVRVLPIPNTVPNNLETAENGTLTLSVPPGNYQLFVSFPWFTPSVKKIQVHQGKTEQITVVLENPGDTEIVSTGDHRNVNSAEAAQPHPVSVTIKVTDQTGAAVPFAQVWVAGEQHEVDERGTLHLNLVPNAYYFTVTSPLFKRWRERLQIRAGTAIIPVTLTKTDVQKISAE